jgi:drug/metabolite transporter (DMT)-like permease
VDFKMMVQSPGYIFGPLMLALGVVAVVLCARATRRGDRPSAWRAAYWSLSPIAAGLVGAVVGAVVWAATGQQAADRSVPMMHLAYTVLFGGFVALLPLLWSATLFWTRPAPAV